MLDAFPAFIHRINDEWVTAARRISPPLLIDLLSVTGEQVIDHWNAADMSPLGWPVSWAGPDPAPVWLDAGRDFSEYWTHYQQVSEAVGHRPPGRRHDVAPVQPGCLPAQARAHATVHGDELLAAAALDIVSILY